MRFTVNESAQITVLTMLGYVTFSRKILRPVKEDGELLRNLTGKKQIIPFDEYIGISSIPFKITPYMMLKIAKEGCLANSYEDVSTMFLEKMNIKISDDTIRTVTDYVAKIYRIVEDRRNQEAVNLIDELKSIPECVKFTREEAGILCFMTDGCYSPLIGITPDSKKVEWKDTKVALIYNIYDCTKIGKKSIYIKDYAVCVGSKEEFVPFVAGLLVRNDAYYYSEVCSVADGALWIENMISQFLPHHVGILDIAHFKEKIGIYYRQIYSDDELAERWIKVAYGLVDRGQWKRLMNLKNVAKNKDLKQSPDKINLYRYLENHSNLLDYPVYVLRDYATASGNIESTNKFLVEDRAKGHGRRWTKEKLQGVLSLRARFFSGRWDDVETVFINHCCVCNIEFAI